VGRFSDWLGSSKRRLRGRKKKRRRHSLLAQKEAGRQSYNSIALHQG
jgi:hypothetical protein